MLSPQLPQWGLKFLAPAIGAALALSAALAAACFVKAFGITFLGRPRTGAAQNAREADAFSLSAMFVLVLLCLVAGILPGYFIDALAPVVQIVVGGHLQQQTALRWLTIVPITEGRSSYNGLLLFVLIAGAATLASYVIHRWASHAIRRSASWDCGFPDASPATQYTAGSFAQPIRRVFGTLVFQAREEIQMPAPGDLRPARMHVHLRDRVWDTFYAPVARFVGVTATHLNRVQYLTLRGYLTLVSGALVALLAILALWQ